MISLPITSWGEGELPLSPNRVNITKLSRRENLRNINNNSRIGEMSFYVTSRKRENIDERRIPTNSENDYRIKVTAIIKIKLTVST